MKQTLRGLFAALLFCAVGSVQAAANTSDNTKATATSAATGKASASMLIVLDASGSMAGQINGKAKIDIAREAIAQLLADWDAENPLGLMVYGHRSKEDCKDIELLVPIGELAPKPFMEKIKTITPRGKTPLGEALQEAAKALRHKESKATVVLVSDGKETCDADPCAIAKELKAEGLDFVTHVVGFQVDKDADSQLACVAKASGGEYVAANDAQALNAALQSVTKTAPQILSATGKLILSASASEGGEALEAYHDFARMEGNGSKKNINADCESDSNAPCVRELPAGEYVISSRFGELEVITPFTIRAGEEQQLNVVLATGKLTLSASKNGQVVEAYHLFERVAADGEQEDINADCESDSNAPCVRELPPGEYVINSTYGEDETREDKTTPLTIAAGDNPPVNIDF